jgi:hypothetical protein
VKRKIDGELGSSFKQASTIGRELARAPAHAAGNSMLDMAKIFQPAAVLVNA